MLKGQRLNTIEDKKFADRFTRDPEKHTQKRTELLPETVLIY